MASQPNNCMLSRFQKDLYQCSTSGSEDVSEINFIDFYRMVFDTNDFNHVYNGLTLRPGKHYQQPRF